LAELLSKVNGIQVTTKYYNISLVYNQYVTGNYWRGAWEIPTEDLEECGTPISVCFSNSDSSAGMAAFDNVERTKCTFGGNSTSGTARITYLKL
jgi:hypothetical protein